MPRPVALVFLLTVMLCALLLPSMGLMAQDQEVGPEAEPSAPAVEAKALTSGDDFNPTDTLWVMISSAFVLMMTAPGLALFYGGLVRKKNILSVMMQCVFLMGLMTLVWFLWGYSLAFDEDILNGFFC